ncbi:cytoskeleton protein RodZ [Arenicella sp. 4NH20-0111]|uniref:helix-turn-helix domain-containing protein n=1 Tax=Arenicella sp. 4NH20-0111 TaxID=3127648 RepID=UPI0031023E71
MEEKTTQIEERELAPQLGSGAMLAAARKKQDKSIEEIADELNLSLTQIRSIELDQSEGLPEPTYVRGYIRSYAKLLGLDAEEVLSHYLNKNWQKSANLDDMPRGIGDADTAESSTFSPVKVIVFISIAGIVAFLWMSGSLTSLLKGANSSRSQVVETVSGEVLTSEDISASEGPIETEIQSSAGPLLDSEAGASAAEEALSEEEPINDAPEPISTETNVVLTFTETSWVDIRDEQQNRLAYQSYPSGETLDVSAEGALSVLIGNAKGVQMMVNGQDYDLSQHTEGVYAKFTVGDVAP